MRASSIKPCSAVPPQPCAVRTPGPLLLGVAPGAFAPNENPTAMLLLFAITIVNAGVACVDELSASTAVPLCFREALALHVLSSLQCRAAQSFAAACSWSCILGVPFPRGNGGVYGSQRSPNKQVCESSTHPPLAQLI